LDEGSAARLVTHRIPSKDPQDCGAFRQGDIAVHPQRAHRRKNFSVAAIGAERAVWIERRAYRALVPPI